MTELETTRPLTPAEVSWKTAQRVSNTPFVPTAFRGKPEAVFAAILFGEELGIGPMQSLNSIHVIEGKPSMSPELMRALVARAGHRIDVKEATNERVTLWGKRCDNDSEATVTWTMDDAKQAGLAGRGAWKTYPRAMLLARATSELCRMVFADVVAGLSYTDEEVASVAGVDWEEAPIDPLQGAIAPTPVAEPERAPVVGPEMVDLEAEFGGEIIDAELVDDPIKDAPESPGIVSVKQLGKIRVLFKEWGLNRDEQLNLISIILNRHLDHMSKMTKGEASKVIDYLVNEHPGGVV